MEGKTFINLILRSFPHSRSQFIQQDSYAALNPVKTIAASLRAPIKYHYRHKTYLQIETQIKELLVKVGLNPPAQFLSKYPHMLSGGQRQRILCKSYFVRPCAYCR